MKSLLLLSYFIITFIPVKSQVVFNETFGQSTTRLTSPYMPASSFIWADPAGTSDQKMIENNHYAVIAPNNIRDAWPVPQWWFWTGTEPVGNTWGGAFNPATTDHTGDANGAVMVVNAGSTVNGIYQRTVNVTSGGCYRLSMFMYLVNSSSSLSLQLRDPSTKALLGSYNTGYIGTEDVWQQFNYDFQYPAGCSPNGQIEIYITNTTSAFSGNDYYVDDISLTQVACSGAPEINCSSVAGIILPVKISDFKASSIENNKVQIQWKSLLESNIKNYIIEKSYNGLNFSNVLSINSGTNNNQNNYTVFDNLTNDFTKNIYYRIKIVDNRGNISYSDIIKLILIKDKFSLNIFPQPAINGSFEATWSNYGTYKIDLLNATGNKIQTWNNYNGNNIKIENLKSGTYILKITNTKKNIESISQKIVVL